MTFPSYCPHLDGNVFDWILKEAQKARQDAKRNTPIPAPVDPKLRKL